MATLHRPLQHAAHLPRRTVRTTLTAGLLAGSLLAAPTAHAAPGDGDARSEHSKAVVDVAAVQARVTEAEETLQRMTIEAEAASGTALAAQAALDAAQAEVDALWEGLDVAGAPPDAALPPIGYAFADTVEVTCAG